MFPELGNAFVLLTDQGSNLDSSGPKPDVLPVTPSVNTSFKITIPGNSECKDKSKICLYKRQF
jgi:hypothetical protein